MAGKWRSFTRSHMGHDEHIWAGMETPRMSRWLCHDRTHSAKRRLEKCPVSPAQIINKARVSRIELSMDRHHLPSNSERCAR